MIIKTETCVFMCACVCVGSYHSQQKADWENEFSHLVIDQQFHGVVPPLDEDQFIGLSGCRVRKGRPQTRPYARLDPKTQSQSEDLLQQRPLHPPVHVVGSHGEADLEGIRILGFLPVGTCFWKKNGIILFLTVSPWVMSLRCIQ